MKFPLVVHPGDSERNHSFGLGHHKKGSSVKVTLLFVLKEVRDGQGHFLDGLKEDWLVLVLGSQLIQEVKALVLHVANSV